MSNPALQAIAADHVFDGTIVRERATVILEGSRIAELARSSAASPS